MSVKVVWVPTDKHVYGAIYREHAKDLTVFASHTCIGGCMFDSEPRILTEWGFKDADTPLIKSECIGDRSQDNGRWSFWIASVVQERDE